MTGHVKRTLEMLQRIHRFMLEHPIALPRANAALAEIIVIISALASNAAEQVGGRHHSAGGVERRHSTWRALRRYLADINHTARTLEPEHPGIRSTFRLPRTRSYPTLLAAARSIIEAATRLKDSFVACGLAEGFLDEIAAFITEFEVATTQKLAGKIAQVANTAGLKEQAARGIIAATKLDACMRNLFRRDPEMLAAWKHARHIERTPSPVVAEELTSGANATSERGAVAAELSSVPLSQDSAEKGVADLSGIGRASFAISNATSRVLATLISSAPEMPNGSVG